MNGQPPSRRGPRAWSLSPSVAQRIHLTMWGLAALAANRDDPEHPRIEAELTAALAITGPLIFDRYVLKIDRDGRLVGSPARKPHRECYRNARSVPVPASILGTIELVAEEGGAL